MDYLLGEVHPSCKQLLNYRTGCRKKALAFGAENQSQGSYERDFQDLSAAAGCQVVHNGD